MAVISVVNTKGGAGKTTTAIYLACAAAARGLDVEVLDADPQGTATDWAYAASDADMPLPFPVKLATAATLRRGLNHADGSVVIIDTPPGQSEVVTLAIEVADFVVLPTKTTNADMWRTLPTSEASNHKPQAVLVTQTRPGTVALREVTELLESEDMSYFSTTIGLREAIGASVGSRPEQFYGYDDVLADIFTALHN